MATGRINRAAYLFILPTFAALIGLKYYPAVSAVYHSFFQWDGATVGRFVGLANYVQLFRDEIIHVSAINIVKFIIGRGRSTSSFRCSPPSWSFTSATRERLTFTGCSSPRPSSCPSW